MLYSRYTLYVNTWNSYSCSKIVTHIGILATEIFLSMAAFGRSTSCRLQEYIVISAINFSYYDKSWIATFHHTISVYIRFIGTQNLCLMWFYLVKKLTFFFYCSIYFVSFCQHILD